ncbi:MAG: AbrB/MazE/SpoVT family DNA-binding domain-containing protein [Xanthomonadales bacterium]|nr:AbrB/MazE/SpoVT family DNA-binding domain-containing protein [Xanthomonadales bacterium]
MYIQTDDESAAMRGQIAKWGNSLALRLPKQVLRDARITEGATVSIELREGSVILTPVRPTFTLAQLLTGYESEHRQPETDWGPARGEEAW